MSQYLLKELSDDDFKEKYNCDRFTAIVLGNRFRYIVDHMCKGLLTTAFSIILRDWYDFAATISGPPEMDYPMPAVSNSLAVFTMTMPEAVSNTVEEYGIDNLRQGDVLICNDPYRTGTHVNDCCFIRPVFNLGNKLVGFITIQAHMLDMGGTVPAGFSGGKRNIFENGLVLGGQLLYKDDKPYKPTWNLIFDNTRFGDLLIPDIKTIYQNLLLGERLILETIDRYGLDAYYGAMRYTCDISEESMREGIARLPDGVYEGEDLIDCDGADDTEEYRIKVKITIKGDKAEVDLNGTSRQARTCINCGWLDTKVAVAIAFKLLIDPTTPITSASIRPIDIVLPPGTILSAMPPDGAIFLYWEPENALAIAILRTLRDVIGECAIAGEVGSLNLHNANGVWPETGITWVNMAQCGGEHGPWGATKAGDGDSYNVGMLGNNLDPATEAIESDFPVLVLRKEYVTDTAGAGKNRGGAAVVKDSLWLHNTEHYSMPLHFKIPSGFGVFNGKDGMTGGTWVWEPDKFDVAREKRLIGLEETVYKDAIPVGGVLDPDTGVPKRDGVYFYTFRVPVWQTKPNTVFRYITNAGGGWGDPLEREPEKVKKDVRDEYVSIEIARKNYGVIIKGDPLYDPEGLEIDYKETIKLRTELKALR